MGLFSALFGKKTQESKETGSSDKRYNLIFFDTETTGLSQYDDEILQLSIIDDNGMVLFNEYFKPVNRKRWDSAMRINGISPKFVADKNPFSFYKKQIQEIFDQCSEIAGYNVSFDIGFLDAAGILGIRRKKKIDVMSEYSAYAGGREKLERAANSLGYKFKAHDSLEDVKATLYVHQKLREHPDLKQKQSDNSSTATKSKRLTHEEYLQQKIGDKTIEQLQKESTEEIVYRRFKPNTPVYAGLHMFSSVYPPREGFADLSNDEKKVFQAFSDLMLKEELPIDKIRMVRHGGGEFQVDHPKCWAGKFNVKTKQTKYDIYPLGKATRKKVTRSLEEANAVITELGEGFEIRERSFPSSCSIQISNERTDRIKQFDNISVDECIEQLPLMVAYIKRCSKKK